MGNGGCHSAVLKPIALEIAQANVAGALVALHHGHFQNVLLHVHLGGVALVRGKDFAIHQTDDTALALVAEIVHFQLPDVEGVPCPLQQIRVNLGPRHIAAVVVAVPQLALFKDHFHLEVFQTVHYAEIGQIAGGDGAPVVELIISGGVVAGYLDGNNRVYTGGDGPTHNVVNMALLQNVVGMAVVTAEHAALIVLRRQQGQQRIQILGRRTLPNHNVLAQTQLGQCVLHVVALVVGIDAGSHIGGQVLFPDAGGVAVNLLVVGLGCHNFLQCHGIGGDDTGIVHHFRQTVDSGMLIEGVDGPVVQYSPGLIQGRGRDAGGQHKPHIHRQALGGLEHVVDAVGAHDVGNFMGICDNGGGAVGQHCTGKLPGADQGTFQMNVGVNETRQDDFAVHVVGQAALIGTHAHNQPLGYGNVGGAQLIGKHIDIGGVLQNQVSRFQSGGHADDPLLFPQLAVDLAGIAFVGVCHRTHPFALGTSDGKLRPLGDGDCLFCTLYHNPAGKSSEGTGNPGYRRKGNCCQRR